MLKLAMAAVALLMLAPDASRIGVAELSRHLDDPAVAVVDVRADEAYNGWKQDGEPRGGHIPGAVQLSPDLLDDPAKIAVSLERSGVERSRRVVVAARDDAGSIKAAQALRGAGWLRVTALEGGTQAWLARAELPVDRLPGYRMLVPPAWVDGVRRGAAVAEPPAGRVTLLHVAWGGPEKLYAKGHIPGALHLDTNRIEADQATAPRGFWRLLPPAELQATIEQLGITRDSTVVLYSDPNFAAARAAWALVYAGVRDVRVLNGGLRAWQRAGLPVETRAAPAPVRRAFGATVPQRPDVRHDTEWVKAHLLDPEQSLADIRSWKEFVGEISGYDDIPEKGRIPGAKWAKGGANPQSLTGDYEDEDGTFRAYTEVDAMWRRYGMPADKPMTFYCGTGWRASQGWMYAWMLERPTPAVYDSGWMDWSMGPGARTNPVELGKP